MEGKSEEEKFHQPQIRMNSIDLLPPSFPSRPKRLVDLNVCYYASSLHHLHDEGTNGVLVIGEIRVQPFLQHLPDHLHRERLAVGALDDAFDLRPELVQVHSRDVEIHLLRFLGRNRLGHFGFGRRRGRPRGGLFGGSLPPSGSSLFGGSLPASGGGLFGRSRLLGGGLLGGSPLRGSLLRGGSLLRFLGGGGFFGGTPRGRSGGLPLLRRRPVAGLRLL
mmetsp:Transcript_41287/g.88012  ORF Transcript_41287/g.88012 Transcript_41287/m.88012 type:complete len:220 (-) Transcript_41287:734-1393(-)